MGAQCQMTRCRIRMGHWRLNRMVGVRDGIIEDNGREARRVG